MTEVIQPTLSDSFDFKIQADDPGMCLKDVTQVELSFTSGALLGKVQLTTLKKKGYGVSEAVNGVRTISKRLQLSRSQLQSRGVVVELIGDFRKGSTGQLDLFNSSSQFLGSIEFSFPSNKKGSIKTRINLQSSQKNSCAQIQPVVKNATITQASGPLLIPIASPTTNPTNNWVKAKNHTTLTNYVFGLAIGPDPQLMYAATVDGVRKSTDGGLNWYGTAYNKQADNVAIAASDPNIVYASSGEVWKSTDGGANWTEILSQAGGSAYAGLAVSPSDANVVLAGTKRSTNGGVTWSTNGLSEYVTQIKFIDANTVYASSNHGSNSSGGLFKSTDGGLNWGQIATLGVNGFIGSYGVTSFDVNKNNPNHIVAASYGLVHYTFDGGSSWTLSKLNDSDFSGRYIAIDPSNPNIVYSADYSLSMARSTDGGVSFQTFHSGLTPCNVYTVAVNSNGRAFVGNSDACNEQGNYGEVYYTK